MSNYSYATVWRSEPDTGHLTVGMNAADIFLRPSEVHVWAVWLKAPDLVGRAYRTLLNPQEIAKADRFAFEHLKHSYEISQGALRLLLARYLHGHPREFAFRFGSRGKPALDGDSRIRFNMSHSGRLALYALTDGVEIGVDVEAMREIGNIEDIASRRFCDAEASDLLSIRDTVRIQEGFFRCWTRKEAYIKAVGTGLYLPLNQFQVTLLPEEPVRFVHIGHDPILAAEWTLQHLEPAPNYVGALAYHTPARNIVFHAPMEPRDLLHQVLPDLAPRGE